MSNRQKLMGHLYAIFTTLVWGSCFVLTKVMLTAYTPTQIIPLRMGLAYLALWALRPKTMKLPWKDELMFILIGPYLRCQRQYSGIHVPYPNGDFGAAVLPQGGEAGQVGLHRRRGSHRRRGDGGTQRHSVLPSKPLGRPAGSGRRPHVGGVLHPRQKVYRALRQLPCDPAGVSVGLPDLPAAGAAGCFWECSATPCASPSGTSPSSGWAWSSPTTTSMPLPSSLWWRAGCCWGRKFPSCASSVPS